MSEEDVNKWVGDAQDTALSRSCSCFEMHCHDPVLSRLATQLFTKTKDYLETEVSTGQDMYTLLEEVNRLTITKHADLRSLVVNLSKTLKECNHMYAELIRPLLLQIDQFDSKVAMIEANAYRLDSYTKQLKARFKQLQEN
ncbi:biogenesis of lysosome-related organelles complex 1 subunit 2 isoform X2 [Bicyclus anynana]|uniref:Biogenesis of lysosome-related organelles complex 1 subunit 2 isoform X2 n=1 Tax=Bicyclus anynana TaxID=110368 RepID=A0A6J1N510_BICAN|nr:biogenesis of lysosome-related organelles complex 1 subunit 2 isoform X2 [Bicyclus anynana]